MYRITPEGLSSQRSPYRVYAARMERVTFQQAPTSHRYPLEQSISFNGVLRIDGTGRMEAACGTKHRRHTGPVDRQQADAEVPHDEGSPTRTNRCLCNVLRHTLCSSTNGTFRHCRFGKTRNACPALNVGRTARPNSRNRRFALFRRTAVPNRRPMTIPIMVSWGIVPGQIWRLNNPVETRRPFFLMSWISPLRFKKNDADACPAVITNLSAGYQVRPGFNRLKPHIARCIAHVLPRPG